MGIAPAELEIRPIEPGDKASLAAAVDESSDDAVYRRFLNPHGRLTASELRYLTEIDHRDHEALVALDPAGTRSVGVARYVRDHERRTSAEIAVAVLESWQVGELARRSSTDWPTGHGTKASLSSPRSCWPTI